MKPANARELFNKYQSGTCSPEEQAIVEHWLTFGEAAPLNLSEQELAQDFAEIRQRVSGSAGYAIGTKQSHRLWPRMLKIAAAVTAITLGVWLYYISSSPQGGTSSLFANDIAPGKNTATLTLADGRVINLSETKAGLVVDTTKLKYSDGTVLSDTLATPAGDKAQLLIATTPRGGTYQIVLPDGTRVWLNAASSIKFPSRFSGKERYVEADGEAYFEVSKDPARPFRVESRGQLVEVLGTHFNINSYADEEGVETTLTEGSVQVSLMPDVSGFKSGTGTGVRLSPGQQSLTSGKAINVRAGDIGEALAWKNGEFIFKGGDFESAMRQIARWYDVEVVFQNTKPISLEPRGWVSRSSNLSSVLNMIQSTKEVHFKIEGRRIIVTN